MSLLNESTSVSAPKLVLFDGSFYQSVALKKHFYCFRLLYYFLDFWNWGLFSASFHFPLRISGLLT